MRRIKITYDIVTPESAEIGDFAECGYIDEDGIPIDPDSDDIEEHDGELPAVVALAVKVIGNCVEASDYPRWCPGTWYTEADGSIDYATGAQTRQSFHLEEFSAEEQQAIYKAITGR